MKDRLQCEKKGNQVRKGARFVQAVSAQLGRSVSSMKDACVRAEGCMPGFSTAACIAVCFLLLDSEGQASSPMHIYILSTHRSGSCQQLRGCPSYWYDWRGSHRHYPRACCADWVCRSRVGPTPVGLGHGIRGHCCGTPIVAAWVTHLPAWGVQHSCMLVACLLPRSVCECQCMPSSFH